ncbi:MAG: Spy/CpxP family protein refolding chaperone [Candidatus Omnitrophota bacterium]
MLRFRQIHAGVLTGVILLTMAGVSLAQGKEDRHEGPPPSEKEWKQEEKSLGLSAEQRTQMKALREEFKVKQDALRAQIKSRKEALRQELNGANPDRVKAEGIVKETSIFEQQAAMQHVDHILKIRSILTPEQFQKLHQLHEKKMGQKGHRMHHGGNQDDSKDEAKEK